MDFKVVRELERIDYCKSCSVLTCAHYAGGFCIGCQNDECEFVEKTCNQDY